MNEPTQDDTQATEDAATAVADPVDEAQGEEKKEEYKMSVNAEIEDAGPCRKHIRIRVPQEDIAHFYGEEVADLADKAEVPGFRVGHVPKKLIEKRFKKELSAQVKQKLLVQSLEQVAEDHELDPISEPNIDFEAIELPEEGDFEYEFDVEVRPDFDLPDYKGLKIERPTREIGDEDVEAYRNRYLEQYATREEHDGAAEAGDYVTFSAAFTHEGRPLHKIGEVTAQIRETLQFQDAELEGFDKLMTGAKAGDVRETELKVSTETENVEMRGETIAAKFTIKSVARLKMPELTAEFLERVGVEDSEELNDEIRATLNRQVEYQQRQACRRQVLSQITQSADWELPEELVLKQVENALRREILEMQQAGFTAEEIRARENEIRQRAVSNTEQALKEHFVLDRIAEKEEIEVTPGELDFEIQMMAMQRGESARRVRARLEKSGMDENLAAQIRERKAVDIILDQAEFTDKPMDPPVETKTSSVGHSVCGMTSESARDEDEDESDD